MDVISEILYWQTRNDIYLVYVNKVETCYDNICFFNICNGGGREEREINNLSCWFQSQHGRQLTEVCWCVMNAAASTAVLADTSHK